MIECTTSLRVRYGYPTRCVTHTMECTLPILKGERSDLMRSIGLPYPEFESMGFQLPVIEAHAVCKKPAR